MNLAKFPPSPRGLPLLGGSLDYTRDPLTYLLNARKECGDVAYLRLYGMAAYFINHPDLIERVMVTDNRHYQKDYFLRRMREILGQGLFTSDGEEWRLQRRLMQPAFHRERIAGYAEIMVDETEKMLATFVPGEVRDLHADLMTLTLRIVSRTLLGTDVQVDTQRTGQALETLANRFSNSASGILYLLFPWLSHLPLPQSLRYRRALAELDEMLYRIIAERRKTGPGEDLLSMLLQAQDEQGRSMTDTQLRDEAMTTFLAGHETAALALTYAILCLSGHGDAQTRLRREIFEVLGSRRATAFDQAKLRYTESVVLESIRLYPPIWALGRETNAEVELGGYQLKKGSQVWISQWVMHRDERYFADPESFRPERWEDGLAKRLPRFAYFPFGGGPRLCIGNAFGMMEATLVLATIARRFRLEVLPGYPQGFVQTATLRPRGGLLARVSAAE